MKGFWRRLLLAGLLLGGPLGALEENVRLELKVDPPDAQVFLLGSAEDVRKTAPRPLGRANEPLLVERRLFPTGDIVLTFRAEGYHEVTRSFNAPNQFKNLDFVKLPTGEGEVVEMVALGWNWLAIGIGVLGVGLVGGGAFYLRGRKTEVRDMKRWVTENMVKTGEEDPLLGRALGPYWIVERLGRGGMATVYRGVRAEVGVEDEEVAIKVVHSHIAESPDFRARFRREIAISTSLFHPGIISVFDSGVEEARPYLVLELVRASDLRSHIPEGGFSFERAREILVPVFEAVSFAHGQGVVHRDLKPENVLMTAEGRPKLTDFGLARSHSFSTVTATGSILGTPGYMAPEQISGKGHQPATDQYALGVMLFELCTGRLPFENEDVMQIIMSHLSYPPPNPSSYKANLPADVDTLVQKMMSKDPDARYPTVADALLALESIR